MSGAGKKIFSSSVFLFLLFLILWFYSISNLVFAGGAGCEGHFVFNEVPDSSLLHYGAIVIGAKYYEQYIENNNSSDMTVYGLTLPRGFLPEIERLSYKSYEHYCPIPWLMVEKLDRILPEPGKPDPRIIAAREALQRAEREGIMREGRIVFVEVPSGYETAVVSETENTITVNFIPLGFKPVAYLFDRTGGFSPGNPHTQGQPRFKLELQIQSFNRISAVKYEDKAFAELAGPGELRFNGAGSQTLMVSSVFCDGGPGVISAESSFPDVYKAVFSDTANYRALYAFKSTFKKPEFLNNVFNIRVKLDHETAVDPSRCGFSASPEMFAIYTSPFQAYYAFEPGGLPQASLVVEGLTLLTSVERGQVPPERAVPGRIEWRLKGNVKILPEGEQNNLAEIVPEIRQECARLAPGESRLWTGIPIPRDRPPLNAILPGDTQIPRPVCYFVFKDCRGRTVRDLSQPAGENPPVEVFLAEQAINGTLFLRSSEMPLDKAFSAVIHVPRSGDYSLEVITDVIVATTGIAPPTASSPASTYLRVTRKVDVLDRKNFRVKDKTVPLLLDNAETPVLDGKYLIVDAESGKGLALSFRAKDENPETVLSARITFVDRIAERNLSCPPLIYPSGSMTVNFSATDADDSSLRVFNFASTGQAWLAEEMSGVWDAWMELIDSDGNRGNYQLKFVVRDEFPPDISMEIAGIKTGTDEIAERRDNFTQEDGTFVFTPSTLQYFGGPPDDPENYYRLIRSSSYVSSPVGIPAGQEVSLDILALDNAGRGMEVTLSLLREDGTVVSIENADAGGRNISRFKLEGSKSISDSRKLFWDNAAGSLMGGAKNIVFSDFARVGETVYAVVEATDTAWECPAGTINGSFVKKNKSRLTVPINILPVDFSLSTLESAEKASDGIDRASTEEIRKTGEVDVHLKNKLNSDYDEYKERLKRLRRMKQKFEGTSPISE